MNENKLKKIVNYIVNQGVEAIKDNTEETVFTIDYLAIFANNDFEYKDLVKFVSSFGKETDASVAKTGQTFILDKVIKTSAGDLKYLKIRKPDPTRPQKGAPDFKINNYNEFKKKYLQKSGNFTLMVRDNFEIIELKGVDVLVYFPNQLASDRG